MSAPTEDDLDNLPEAELLALPGEAIPPGRLTAFFVRRAALLHQQELDELAFERSGNSARHFLIFPDTDPKQRQRREEEARRRAWLAEQELLEYRQRTDRLLAQIENQQHEVEKRRKEIEYVLCAMAARRHSVTARLSRSRAAFMAAMLRAHPSGMQLGFLPGSIKNVNCKTSVTVDLFRWLVVCQYT